ncbi:DUF3999 family protein [Gaetbulibacter aquiaggeris]|uniref:DUF3999 family protein n=1 Tax=Gaetbulibacter aquiaggeris TaxID=1735373 RepID=A0ABW7MKB6_9FLAO
MTLKIKLLTCFSLLIFALSFAQMQKYSYQRALIGVQDPWHKLTLPDDIFEKVSPSLSDIRVYGITTKNDTVEASYVLKLNDEKVITDNVPFKILNTSHNEKGYYFTLEVPSKAPINNLQLAFKQFNFDWRINLEGSHDQKEWFSIVEDYRILSIKNAETFYEYTSLSFPNSSYRYFRILVKSAEKSELKSAKASYNTIKNGVFNDYTIKRMNIKDNKAEKRTEIDVELLRSVPVSFVKVYVNASFDYYRPITIQYISDSLKTPKGYLYNYRTLTDGTLTSIEKNEFKFNNTVVKKIKISIQNQDNQPLSINKVDVKGNVYDLDIRFNEPATYYLTYGNALAYKPYYDLDHFIAKTPDTITSINLGEEEAISKTPKETTSPLFENKLWLWLIIIVIIVLLGGFTLKMIQVK